MKLDMHCHTKEGSVDCSVSVREYIKRLIECGFDGMLVTDHDSYGGYRAYRNERLNREFPHFRVFKGVEYDTIDAGHIIVIMPEWISLKVLELRGLPLTVLIDIVHKYGGVLGPAHPCGERFLSYIGNRRAYKVSTMLKFDFVEAFNACEPEESNSEAKCLSSVYKKPGTGGSDSHRLDCIGLGYTMIPVELKRESDLIEYIKSGAPGMLSGGSRYGKTIKDKLGPFNDILVNGFYFYNKLEGLLHRRRRLIELKEIRK
ncbi:MAG: PHP domain-containing protein [Lachnospiraceae bacterium]|nr:PHP domain-containing protein [Lachnospiraceae bacterium]